MIQKKTTFTIENLNILLLFLFTLAFMGSYKIWLGLLILQIICKQILYRKVMLLNFEFFCLSLSMVSYTALYAINFGIGLRLAVFLIPIPCYYVGISLKFDSQRDKQIQKYILSMVLGFAVHGLLNLLRIPNVSSVRYVMEFWGNSILVATLQSTFFTMISSLLFYAIIPLRKFSIILIAGILVALFSALVTATRTPFVITALVFALNIFIYFLINKKKSFFKMFIIFCTIFIFVYFLYKYNVWNVKNFIESSSMMDRLNTSDADLKNDIRIDAQLHAIKQTFVYPLGGRHMDLLGLSYAHNLWLDVLYTNGFIPFILLLLYSISTCFTVLRIVRSKKATQSNIILIGSIFVGTMLNFLSEPILEGVPYFFSSFCLINGMCKKYLTRLK